jgi:hypothetical protein
MEPVCPRRTRYRSRPNLITWWRRARRRVKAAAKKLRPNTAAKRAEPRDPPASVVEPEPAPVRQEVQAQIDEVIRKMDRGTEWMTPSRRP